MKKFITASACALLLLMSGVQGASAATSIPDESAIRDRMSSLGIANATQDDLIAKLATGVVPDSDVAGAVPVSEVEMATASQVGTLQTFADGSAKFSGYSNVSNPRLRSTYVAGCAVSGGTGYTNYSHCTFGTVTVMVGLYFVADFSILAGTNNDYIAAVYSGYTQCLGGSCSGANVRLVKAREDSAGRALAQATTNWVMAGGGASKTYGVSLVVGGNGYSVSEF